MNEQYPSSTVVSILPFEIRESKPNLYPGMFTIPAGSFHKPGLLKVTNSRFYIPMAFGAPSMAAHSPAYEVAHSIVNDYVGALLGVTVDCRPGIFAVNRDFRDEIQARDYLSDMLPEAKKAQDAWFFTLVNLADQDFNKHHQAQSVSDLQKIAARELNIRDKPWLLDITQLQLSTCPACFTPVNAQASICSSCRYVINPEKYKTMQFAVEVRDTNSPVSDDKSKLLVPGVRNLGAQ